MDKDLEKYYEEQFSMFMTQGWKDFMEDIEKMLDATDRIQGVANDRELQFRLGELSILKLIANRQEMANRTYNELKAET